MIYAACVLYLVVLAIRLACIGLRALFRILAGSRGHKRVHYRMAEYAETVERVPLTRLEQERRRRAIMTASARP